MNSQFKGEWIDTAKSNLFKTSIPADTLQWAFKSASGMNSIFESAVLKVQEMFERAVSEKGNPPENIGEEVVNTICLKVMEGLRDLIKSIKQGESYGN